MHLDGVDHAGQHDREEDVAVEVGSLGHRARHDRRTRRGKRRLKSSHKLGSRV